MDVKEFGRWWKDYATRFPATSRWINDLGENAQGLLRTWAETLADVPLRDAMAITRQMATDQLAPVGSFDSDRERTAVIVRRAAKALRASEARTATPSAPAPIIRGTVAALALDEQGRPVTLRELTTRLGRYLSSGRTPEEARAEAFRGLTWTKDDFDFKRDAFRCCCCRDAGTVTVWDPALHETAIFRPELIRSGRHNRRSCCAPCFCEEGTKRIWSGGGLPPPNWRGWRSRWTQYAVERYCRVEDHQLGDDEAERFITWAKGYYERLQKASGGGANERAAQDSEEDPQRSLDF